MHIDSSCEPYVKTNKDDAADADAINAMVETFFKTLKSELVWRTAFQTRAEATEALARYIDGFYNPRRRHSALCFAAQFSSR